ncbi:hypothetical protein [Pedobacter sp. SYP-B3415]|uniref:hypothetical protein n=1 Tax=Pedobacter sp. SYP-B3415 TaxID=2496641 RepID=UPI001F117033|nr:hypothetical protein [Pedobacter sp. SYP-B3415]
MTFKAIKTAIRTALYKPLNLLTLQKHRRTIRNSTGEINVIIGSHTTNYPNWLPTNIEQLNLLSQSSFEHLFQGKKARRFLAEHVFEHLTYDEGVKALQNCYAYLEKGGRIRIAVPDGFHSNPDYINMVKPGGYGEGAHDHKILYTYPKLTSALKEAGFEVTLLEYYDENHVFHYKDWNSEDGHILRSRRFDKRFNEPIAYSSLIVDGIKTAN